MAEVLVGVALTMAATSLVVSIVAVAEVAAARGRTPAETPRVVARTLSGDDVPLPTRQTRLGAAGPLATVFSAFLTAADAVVLLLLAADSRSGGFAASVYVAVVSVAIWLRTRDRVLSDCACGLTPESFGRALVARNVALFVCGGLLAALPSPQVSLPTVVLAVIPTALLFMSLAFISTLARSQEHSREAGQS